MKVQKHTTKRGKEFLAAHGIDEEAAKDVDELRVGSRMSRVYFKAGKDDVTRRHQDFKTRADY
jgi:hypothetical protein